MSLKRADRERYQKYSVEKYQLGWSCEKISQEINRAFRQKIHQSSILRYLNLAGVKLRKRWTREHGIIDGKKLCRLCADGIPKPIGEFYIRKNGHPYTYCKSCDKKRSVLVARRNRERMIRAERNIATEYGRMNVRCRELLKKAEDFLSLKHIDHDLVCEIRGFFITDRAMQDKIQR